MKRRVKYFLDTYFYFNHQEKKGLISLILLIIFVQLAGLLYASFKEDLPIDVKQLSASEFSLLVAEKPIENQRFLHNKYKYKEKEITKNYTSKYIKDKYKKDTVFNYSMPRKNLALNLNEADSIALVGLPKIGPVLAGRIIQYRSKLGGFHHTSQLTEVWGFKEDLLYDLQGRIFVSPQQTYLININTVTIDDLKRHPYFKFTLSQALVNYRKQHGQFQSLLDLKKIRLVNDSIYNLISPYCTY